MAEIKTKPTEVTVDAFIGAVESERRRDEARAAKDWATADSLRDELVALGYEVSDGPDGTVIRTR